MDMVQPLSLKSGSDLVVIHGFASRDIIIYCISNLKLADILSGIKMASIIHCSIWKSCVSPRLVFGSASPRTRRLLDSRGSGLDWGIWGFYPFLDPTIVDKGSGPKM